MKQYRADPKVREQINKRRQEWRSVDVNKQHEAAQGVGYRAKPEWREKQAVLRATSAKKRQQKNARYKRMYGISLDDFEMLMKVQGGRCAICQEQMEDRSHRAHSACLDHCHVTGKARGVLCQRCNIALAAFGDGRARLQRALAYVTNPPAKVWL